MKYNFWLFFIQMATSTSFAFWQHSFEAGLFMILLQASAMHAADHFKNQANPQ
jgi:hypothetical protein